MSTRMGLSRFLKPINQHYKYDSIHDACMSVHMIPKITMPGVVHIKNHCFLCIRALPINNHVLGQFCLIIRVQNSGSGCFQRALCHMGESLLWLEGQGIALLGWPVPGAESW